jgi:hypothetical protein
MHEWPGSRFSSILSPGITSLALAGQTPVKDVLALLQNFSAIVLGVTVYALTYKQGPALAMLALTCRVLEAVHNESAIFFAVGSLLFSWLLLQGRLIPTFLAQLGVVASALLVVILPLQLAGLLGGTMAWSGSVTWLVWLPILVFEVMLALWLPIKGVVAPGIHN